MSAPSTFLRHSKAVAVPLTQSVGGEDDHEESAAPALTGPLADSGLFWPSAGGMLMCRLRIPGGMVKAAQLRELAAISREQTTGHLQITTRGNLQLRRIAPGDAPGVLNRLRAAGLHLPGDGHLRNLTMGPMAGLDPDELADVRPLIQWMRKATAAAPEFRDLPRKLNIAFDGGGAISCIEESNDIGALAVSVRESAPGVSPGIWYRLMLGGASRSECAFLVNPRDLVPACAAILRLLLRESRKSPHGPPRLKHLVEQLGQNAVLEAVARKEGILAARVPEGSPCLAPTREPLLRHAQIGLIPQKQPGRVAVGVAIPVGQVTAAQLDTVADLAARFGSGEIRLTVWQNLLIPDIDERDFRQVAEALRKAGLDTEASQGAGGVTACAGRHCPHALSDTQGHALAAVAHLSKHKGLEPLAGIHFSGCSRACTRHFTGDIGLLAVKPADGRNPEGCYDISVGGSSGLHQRAGRPVFSAVPAQDVPRLLEKMLDIYRQRRLPEESFHLFCARYTVPELSRKFGVE